MLNGQEVSASRAPAGGMSTGAPVLGGLLPGLKPFSLNARRTCEGSLEDRLKLPASPPRGCEVFPPPSLLSGPFTLMAVCWNHRRFSLGYFLKALLVLQI